MSLYTLVNDNIQRLAVRSDETPHRTGHTKTFRDAKKPGQRRDSLGRNPWWRFVWCTVATPGHCGAQWRI